MIKYIIVDSDRGSDYQYASKVSTNQNGDVTFYDERGNVIRILAKGSWIDIYKEE